MNNPFDENSMNDAAVMWAELTMAAKHHINEHHDRNADKEIYNPIGEAVAVAAFHEPCEVHRICYMDAALASAVSIFVDMRETNDTFTSESILRHFDSLVARQRHMLQAFLWELDTHGTLDFMQGVAGNA